MSVFSLMATPFGVKSWAVITADVDQSKLLHNWHAYYGCAPSNWYPHPHSHFATGFNICCKTHSAQQRPTAHNTAQYFRTIRSTLPHFQLACLWACTFKLVCTLNHHPHSHFVTGFNFCFNTHSAQQHQTAHYIVGPTTPSSTQHYVQERLMAPNNA